MNSWFDESIVNELYPGAGRYMLPAMLIHKGEKDLIENAITSDEYFAELKKDGCFYSFVKGSEGLSYLFSRTISKATGLLTEKIDCVPHIKEALECLPCGTVLIGEIYYPNGSSKETTKVMGSLPERARKVQEELGLIHYYLYDILYFECMPLLDRGALDRKLFLDKVWNTYNLKKYPFLELAEVYTENLESVIAKAFANNEEGVVLKKKDGIYEPDKRPKTNIKVKKQDTLDLVIMGFAEPTREYEGKEKESWQYKDEKGNLVSKAYAMGWHNSRIIAGVYDGNDLVEVANISSGISDEIKEDMSKNPELYLGKVCEVQCMEIIKNSHKLRHAFYISLREDKNPKDCTVETIFS